MNSKLKVSKMLPEGRYQILVCNLTSFLNKEISVLCHNFNFLLDSPNIPKFLALEWWAGTLSKTHALDKENQDFMSSLTSRVSK